MQLHLPLVSDRVLAVIDMQVLFWASQKAQVLNAVKGQLRHAMRNGWAIMFVEWYGHGLTDVRLTNVVGNYERQARVTKEQDSGALELLAECDARGWPTDFYRLVGVNTHACVYATACQLKDNRAFVEVYGPGCNDCNFGYGPQSMSRFNIPGVRVMGKAA
jgi:nicotinamidase-related amidase